MASESQPYQSLARPNSEPPSLDAIREKIPKSLFVRSTMYSISFLVKDFAILAILYFIMLQYSSLFDTYFFLYPVIWFIIGTYFWALFVVGMFA
jgi:omega-3 fatty acid desaturase (delta-15 desaturase)